MSDVERICEQNHQRVRWAEEYSDAPVLTFPSRKAREKARKLRKQMRSAAMACAMICGMAAAFVGIGIASMHLPTLIAGAIGCIVFLVSGFVFEAKAEDGEADA